MAKKTVLAVIGNLIIAFGISILNLTGFGIDAFTAMNLGLSSVLHIGLGIVQMCMNIILLVPVMMMDRRSFGTGTIINMFLLGYMVQFMNAGFSALGLTGLSLTVRIVLLVIGLLTVCLGCALYMDCEVGAGPYDAAGPLIEQRTKIPFKYVRIAMDCTCAIIGFVTGMLAHVTTIGIATLCVVAGTGPIISWYREHITGKIVSKFCA